MQPRTKKRLIYVTFGAYYILGGVEYAVILPTLYLYIENEFHAETYYLGLILAAYSLTGLFSGPIMGRLADKTRRIKLLLLICNCFMIGGSIMYWIGLSKNFLVASRLVAGCGAGLESIIIGEIARSTTEAERTGVISILIAVRQSGLLLGPGFNLFLREADFKIGSLSVNKYNAAGAFMAVLWCFMQIITFFFYYDMDQVQEELALQESNKTDSNGDVGSRTICTSDLKTIENGLINTERTVVMPVADRDSEPSSYSGKILVDNLKNEGYDISYVDYVDNKSDQVYHAKTNSSKEDFGVCNKGRESDDDETEPLSSSSELIVAAENVMADTPGRSRSMLEYGTVQRIESRQDDEDRLQEERKMTWKVLLNDFIRDEVIAVVFVSFSCMFNQVAMETMVTPLSSRYLKWGELENSIMYSVAGVQIILVFLVVRWLSRRLLDRTLVAIGWLFIMLATCWLVYAVPSAGDYSPTANIFRFMVGLFLDMCGLPFEMACASSLFSKLMRKEVQGFSQGISRSLTGMSVILAPLWAGSTLKWPYLMIGVMLAVTSLSMVMLLISWPKLKPKSEIEKEQAKKQNHGDRQPLLSSTSDA